MLGGHLELFNIARFELKESKNWYILSGAQTERNYSNIRLHLPKISAGYYVAELVSLMTVENDVNRNLFRVIENGFEVLNYSNREIIASAFAWQLINEIGYHPELYSCVVCKKRLDSGEINFSASRGGLVDDCCIEPDAFLVQTDTVKIIRVEINNINVFQKIKIPQAVVKEFNYVTKKYISVIVEKEIKSDRFVEIIHKLK